MIVVAILAIIASIGVPQYVGALRTARIGKAKHELVTISHAIDAYTANNAGQLPCLSIRSASAARTIRGVCRTAT